MAVSFLQTIPLLRIFDVEKAKAFCVGFLGFAVDWEHLQRAVGAGRRRLARRPIALRASSKGVL